MSTHSSSLSFHGVTENELFGTFLFVPFIDDPAGLMPEGELLANMVVSVEGYAGEVGGQDGVKLEDAVWITSSGPPVTLQYPFDDSFLR